jgi:DNA-binding CsgD family transcriptional regulator
MNQAKLLELIADMQLGNILPDEWLEEITKLFDCIAAGTIVWVGDDTDNNFTHSSENFESFPLNWLHVAEQIVRRSSSAKLDYLDEMAKALNMDDPFPDSPLHDHNLLIILLDNSPTRSLLILQRSDTATGWSGEDRKSISEILPGLRKANDLHKSVILAGNRLDIASKILDGAPRGTVALTPKGHILKANKLALELFNDKDCFDEIDGKLHITNNQIHILFEEKLALVSATKLKYLQDFVWNRSFFTPTNHRKLQIVLRAYPLDNWHLESNRFDRFVALFIHTPEKYIQPSAKDLQEFYGLTGAQAQLVLCLLEGESITEAANKQNIKLNTARSHMQNIYSTMGVEGQADLMRLLSATLVNYEVKK